MSHYSIIINKIRNVLDNVYTLNGKNIKLIIIVGKVSKYCIRNENS